MEGSCSESRDDLVSRFDSICTSYAENDAIVDGSTTVCYAELQYASQAAARQLFYRFRPDIVLVDCQAAPAAELVAIMACMRIGVPFCPVDVRRQHTGKRLQAVVQTLRRSPEQTSVRICAFVRAESDQDPFLTSFVAADVHNCLLVNETGDLLEPMQVPEQLPVISSSTPDDDLYVLFTSGTSSDMPKAIVGSLASTLRRLDWFQKEYPADVSTIVARRARLTFVDGVTELLSVTMAPVVLYTINAAAGMAQIQDSPCTRLTLLPSQLAQWMIVVSDNQPSCLELIVVSGEPCPVSLLDSFKQSTFFQKTVLLNLYGQTETTGDCCWARLTGPGADPLMNNVVPVGRPLPGVAMETEKDDNEIRVSGSCLSNGLYSERKNQPWRNSFHTGDVGFCVDGCWYVQGRVDDVCKINGILTAPSEVETCLQQVFQISSVAIILNGSVYAVVEAIDTGFFCRTHMNEVAGIPWNLIPKQVFAIASIPSSSSGAGKVNRNWVKELIRQRLLDERKSVPSDEPSTTGTSTATPDALLFLLSIILNVPVARLRADHSSFVELGGDSALAVTLLYRLKVDGLLSADENRVTAKEILLTNNLQELGHLIDGNRKVKKQKLDESLLEAHNRFRPLPMEQVSEHHRSLRFAACVDATPFVYNNFVFGACQGGVVQRVDLSSDRFCSDDEPCCFQLGENWKVQAGMIVIEDDNEKLVVCGYDPIEETGVVFALCLDLKVVWWKQTLDGMIKTAAHHRDKVLYLLAGKNFYMLDSSSGEVQHFRADEMERNFLAFPASSESNSVLVQQSIRADGGAFKIACAFSDWDAGIYTVDYKSSTFATENLLVITCPIYADLLLTETASSPTLIVAADISGNLHEVDLDRSAVRSFKVASSPIFSSPTQVFVGEEQYIVFGCHDGFVYCVHPSNLANVFWKYNVGAVVYARACPLDNGEVAVCTTAGDVVVIRNDGSETWRYRGMDAEIWSDPVEVAFPNQDKRCVVFGARDSKLHFVDIPSHTRHGTRRDVPFERP